jgi:mannose-6-phosphate isomerase-like protein (cupin superfamily)
MKEVKVISKGTNYSAVNVGKMEDLREHKFVLGPNKEMQGKVFVGKPIDATGAEMSFQSFLPGEGSLFIHAHKTHEEMYIIMKGEGEYQVDGDIFPISEGSVIRVSPAGKRAIRNTGKSNMIIICIQYKADSFGADDTPIGDGKIIHEELKWDKD